MLTQPPPRWAWAVPCASASCEVPRLTFQQPRERSRSGAGRQHALKSCSHGQCDCNAAAVNGRWFSENLAEKDRRRSAKRKREGREKRGKEASAEAQRLVRRARERPAGPAPAGSQAWPHSRNHSYQSQTLEGWPQTRHQLFPDSRRSLDT